MGGRGGHSSGPPIAGRFSRPTRTARAGEALPRIADCSGIRGASSLFGLAPGGACRAASVARDAVRSYRTLSPLPRAEARGGLLSVALSLGSPPGGRYPPPSRRGARTFLHPPCGKQRPPGRLVRRESGRWEGEGQAVARGAWIARPVSELRWPNAGSWIAARQNAGHWPDYTKARLSPWRSGRTRIQPRAGLPSVLRRSPSALRRPRDRFRLTPSTELAPTPRAARGRLRQVPVARVLGSRLRTRPDRPLRSPIRGCRWSRSRPGPQNPNALRRDMSFSSPSGRWARGRSRSRSAWQARQGHQPNAGLAVGDVMHCGGSPMALERTRSLSVTPGGAQGFHDRPLDPRP